jgi:dsDNA-specific endonuclease/ATPase MutS2
MSFKIGDTVRFLDNHGGLVEVETNDGFILSISNKKLVIVNNLEGNQAFLVSLEDIQKKELPSSTIEIVPNLPLENEFDLHIEELEVDYRSMRTHEIMKVQLSVFENKLSLSIKNRISPLIFIHGVGNGVLRQEIHKRLGKNPFIEKFQNKGLDSNGFGATEVFLKF